MNVRLGNSEFSVIDGAGIDEHADQKYNEEEAQLLTARLNGENKNLETR